MVGSDRNRSTQRQRRLIMTVSQIETLIVLLATAVLFLWGRWCHDLVALAALMACARGHPEAHSPSDKQHEAFLVATGPLWRDNCSDACSRPKSLNDKE